MKMFNKFKCKKGFTLIECVVAIAIFAIMSAMVMQMLAVTIQKHKNNVHVEKDMDTQIQNIISDNSLVERGTTDLAVEFILSGGATAAEMEIEDISIKKDPTASEADDGRLELNTFGATNLAPDPNQNNEDSGGSMITEDVRIYGAKYIDNVFVSQTAIKDVAGGKKQITIEFKINDTDKILSKSESNALKVVFPYSSEVTKIECDGATTYLKLSPTRFRIFDKDISSKNESSRSVKFTFVIDESKLNSEYVNFAKFFIAPDSTSTITSATFKDTTTPGIYKDVN